MVVIGGGVIGVELAWAYSRFGTKVTILEMLPKLLPMMDAELTQIVRERMEKAGIRIRLDTKVLSVEPCGTGTRVRAKLPGGEEAYFDGDKVLIAVGRRPDIASLNLEAAGVAVENGKIVVDKKMRTNVPDVYAIGDCTGQIMLAHTASAMGETAAHNATGGRSVYRDDVCPSCVYVDPEFAGVGLTEEQAGEKGISFKVGKFPMLANGKALIDGCSEGLVKVIAEKSTGKVIGVHILAPRATDLIAEAALAVRMGVSVTQLADTIHAHPTISESLREAALASDGRAIHIK
jgi:dihydrolipoamide dehydrogenase